ncbi:MAG: type III-B CRISPR module RAMP protein Cmr6 [Candidatus Schekmanbacteria bacterium]|nr:type III-B CRISPR module RAMP protein Cmr6 [Candidatus Schekmanbacteria bacterium]
MATDGRREVLEKCGAWDATAHAGLWLDKYLRVMAGESDQDKQAIRKLIEDAGKIEVPDGYREALQKREQELRMLDGGVTGGVTRVWHAEAPRGRLIIGLGTQSVRETNLALQHTWGVPVLPGSALKGLAAATARRHGEAADHREMFGDTTVAGIVTFHDAWWIPGGGEKRLPVALDIMTVHHVDYYGGGNAAPADWDEPNPVAFATASGSYLVAISGPAAWVEAAAEWLRIGLERDGIGAKTAAGYGRMKLVPRLSEEEKKEEASRAARQALVDRRRTELLALAGQHHGAGTAKQHVEKLRDALKQGVKAEDVREAAERLRDKDPEFWGPWAKKQDKETQAFCREIGLIPTVAAAPATAEAAPATAEAPKTAPAKAGISVLKLPGGFGAQLVYFPVAPAKAGILVLKLPAWPGKDDKKRPTVNVEYEGSVVSRNEKDVDIDAATRAALDAATRDHPVMVLADLVGSAKKKLKAVRLEGSPPCPED